MKQNDKEKLAIQIREVEELFNKQVNQLKQLNDRYEQLDNIQQDQLKKATIRLQKLVQINAKNEKMEQKYEDIINVQEGTYNQFTEEDIENMKKSIKQTKLSSTLISKFNEEISKKISENNFELNVNQKTTKFIQLHSLQYYFGYLLNGVPTGRGVSVYKFQFYNGYFSQSLCQIGICVYNTGYEIVTRKYTIEESLEKTKQGSPFSRIIEFWKESINLIIDRIPEMQQLIVETQEFTTQLIRPEEINNQLQKYQIQKENIEYSSDGYYDGFIQKKQKFIREGFGTYYNIKKQCLAIGIWSNDKLVYGTLLQQQKNLKILGEIPDDVQTYLQYDKETFKNAKPLILRLFLDNFRSDSLFD